jgi:hypothetical protein
VFWRVRVRDDGGREPDTNGPAILLNYSKCRLWMRLDGAGCKIVVSWLAKEVEHLDVRSWNSAAVSCRVLACC